MEENAIGQQEYIEKVLGAYRQTPTTMGTVRPADRLVAAQLYARGVSPRVVENAFILAAARRLMRAPGAMPLPPIRSLAVQLRVSPNYFVYLSDKIRRLATVSNPR